MNFRSLFRRSKQPQLTREQILTALPLKNPSLLWEKNEEGRQAMTRVVLRPLVTFATEVIPAATQLRELHDRAHHECYIANSVRTVVTVELPPGQD